MAAALARLAQATGEQRFADSVHRAVAYERAVFVTDEGNWPDFRSTREPNQFMVSWCHGAPGILLSRHILRAAGLADSYTEAELRDARACTLAAVANLTSTTAAPASHLCCGVLGLASLLRLDAALCGVSLDHRVIIAESSVINQARTSGLYTFFSVDAGSLSLPGLLTGKAGVALALLEAAESASWMPQVLSAGLIGAP